jgi:uncharacterized protein
MKRLMPLALVVQAALLQGPALAAERCPSPETYHAPQPVLPKERLVVLGRSGTEHVFSVEMALTPEQQEIGLMARRSVPADGGMLFDMGTPPERSRFWMCNTVVSLDMVFIKPDGTIDSIAENAVPFSLDGVASQGPVRATLELPAGTAARLGIRVGDKVRQRIFGNAG